MVSSVSLCCHGLYCEMLLPRKESIGLAEESLSSVIIIIVIFSLVSPTLVISGSPGGVQYAINRIWLWPFGSAEILGSGFRIFGGAYCGGFMPVLECWDLVTHFFYLFLIVVMHPAPVGFLSLKYCS